MRQCTYQAPTPSTVASPSPSSSVPAVPFPPTITTPTSLIPKKPLSMSFLQSMANGHPSWRTLRQGIHCNPWHSAKWMFPPPISIPLGPA